MGDFISREIFDCIPEIDFTSGYRYFLGNMDNYKKALLSILKSTKSKLPILNSMQITKEYEGLRMITQTLRKMFGSVGANNLSESTYRLERTLLNESDFDLEAELGDFIEDLSVFAEHLEMLLKQLDVRNSGKKEEDTYSFRNYDFTKTRESIKLSGDLLERKII
jgi:HPt (histidine-containing phosphotransfer) domain-containing protein